MNKLILEQMDKNKLNNHKKEKIAPVIMQLNNFKFVGAAISCPH